MKATNLLSQTARVCSLWSKPMALQKSELYFGFFLYSHRWRSEAQLSLRGRCSKLLNFKQNDVHPKIEIPEPCGNGVYCAPNWTVSVVSNWQTIRQPSPTTSCFINFPAPSSIHINLTFAIPFSPPPNHTNLILRGSPTIPKPDSC